MPQPPYADIVRRNALRWEAMAKHRPSMTLDEHRAGVSALEPGELDLLGDLRGKRVLHLACAVCDEGITMAMRGATVIGSTLPKRISGPAGPRQRSLMSRSSFASAT